MMNKRAFVWAVLFFCAVGMTPSSIQAESIEEQYLAAEFMRASLQIGKLGRDKDVPGLLNKADEVALNWKSRSMEYYGRLMLLICETLRTQISPHNIPIAEIEEVTEKAIESIDPAAEDNISPETHYKILVNLQMDSAFNKREMTDEEWAAKRRVEGERWMVAWDRMKAAIDPNWDSKETISLNAMPPPGLANFDSGMSPEAIRATNKKTSVQGEEVDHSHWG